MKAVAGAFNKQKALLGAFSFIEKLCHWFVDSSNLRCLVQGKLLSKRGRQDPVKMKMIETSEVDIEEVRMPTPSSAAASVSGLPVVDRKFPAFERRDSREAAAGDTEAADVWQLPASSASTPRTTPR